MKKMLLTQRRLKNQTQQRQFDAMMENYLKRLAQQTPASWSAEARAWAEKNGLIAGDEAGNKQYRSFLTREQMAAILYRYANGVGIDTSARGNLAAFPDRNQDRKSTV